MRLGRPSSVQIVVPMMRLGGPQCCTSSSTDDMRLGRPSALLFCSTHDMRPGRTSAVLVLVPMLWGGPPSVLLLVPMILGWADPVQYFLVPMIWDRDDPPPSVVQVARINSAFAGVWIQSTVLIDTYTSHSATAVPHHAVCVVKSGESQQWCFLVQQSIDRRRDEVTFNTAAGRVGKIKLNVLDSLVSPA